MRLGLALRNTGPQAIETVRKGPQEAEAWGYHSVWFADHVVGVRSFAPVYGPEWAEALTSLAYAAASTSSIRLGIGVLVVPYREPVYAAKVLATIDQLSGGRLDVGVGVGWSRSEFHGLGRGELFEQRGEYTDEALDVILRCWQGGEFGWEGKWTNFRRIEFDPVPLQRPRPPLWVGGNSGRALRRAARLADVWHPTRLAVGDVVALGDRLDEMAGRAIPRSVRLRFEVDTPVTEIVDVLGVYADAGCVETVFELVCKDRGQLREVAPAIIVAAREAGVAESGP